MNLLSHFQRASRPGETPALFVTGANERFRPIVEIQRAHLERLGYRSLCFDLGGLGCGPTLTVDDSEFQARGHYHERHGWKTRALHKPALVARALEAVGDGEVVVYLDGDAICYERVDELAGPGFDIGATVRWRWERGMTADFRAYMGRFNAGVIVFRKTPATARFVTAWAAKTEELGNDQRALNALLNPRQREVAIDETFDAAGITARAFDGMIYNNPEKFVGRPQKIVHYKSQSWQHHLQAHGDLPPRPSTPRERLRGLADSARWALEMQLGAARHELRLLILGPRP